MKYTAMLGVRSEIKVLQLAKDAITLSFYLIKKTIAREKKVIALLNVSILNA